MLQTNLQCVRYNLHEREKFINKFKEGDIVWYKSDSYKIRAKVITYSISGNRVKIRMDGNRLGCSYVK